MENGSKFKYLSIEKEENQQLAKAVAAKVLLKVVDRNPKTVIGAVKEQAQMRSGRSLRQLALLALHACCACLRHFGAAVAPRQATLSMVVMRLTKSNK
jgi:hypothetical protein